MEVETAVRRRLLAIPALVGYTTPDRIWKNRLEDPIDGTGRRAVVVARSGSWSLPQYRNTQEYPLVRITCWADHSRNSDGTMTKADGQTAAYAMHRVITPVIHGIRDEWWGGDSTSGLLIIGCSRWGEPMPAADGALSTGRPTPGDADSYEAQGVFVDYAIQTIH